MKRRVSARWLNRACSGGLLETLEPRLLMAGNLAITNAYLVNSSNTPVSTPVVGEQFYIHADFSITGLTAANSYIVRFKVDGYTLDTATITGQTGNLNLSRFRGSFPATGSHNVQVTVDANNTIAETNETDNTYSFSFVASTPAPPFKMIFPLEGQQDRDFVIVNYLDVNPNAVTFTDYQGGNYAYDGHTGIDITLADFSPMDASKVVVAAAAGTVTQVADGTFDRNTAMNSSTGNFIRVDMGGGWTVIYDHFATNTITVKVGDTIKAGQVLGLIGSSGNSTGAHLHFEVLHNLNPVETALSPTIFWYAPLPYQASTAARIMDSGMSSNADPSTLAGERPPDVSTYTTSPSVPVYIWAIISHSLATDVMSVSFYRPNGTLFTGGSANLLDTRGGSWHASLASSFFSSSPGVWQAALSLNGVEVLRKSFTITNSAGPPQMFLYQGTNFIADERTTPIDFGSVTLGSSAPQMSFVASNRDGGTLSITGISLPPGFSLVSGLPANIPAGGSASFTIQMDSLVAGAKLGSIHLTTNDPGAADFNFFLKGTVSGSLVAGSPAITLPSPAALYLRGAGAILIDPGATLTDANSTTFNAGSLTVIIDGNGEANDRLGIQSIGNGAGQIATNGTQVSYAGNVIGTFSGGTGTTPLVVTFNNLATVAATQALMRAITFNNVGAAPAIPRRYVRFTLIDDTGLTSNLPVKVIDVGTLHAVQNRQLFYAGSSFDTGGSTGRDNAIAPDKSALLPGGTAAFANYISYPNGITGVRITVAGATAALSASDLTFRLGNDNSPDAWASAPSALQVISSAPTGALQSVVVDVLWSAGAITNRWLQVTVKGPGGNSGLPADDVFYFGNAIGEAGNDPTSARVDAVDELTARAGIVASAALSNKYDFNRDGKVDDADLVVARTHTTWALSQLALISPPGAGVLGAAVPAGSAAPSVIEAWDGENAPAAAPAAEAGGGGSGLFVAESVPVSVASAPVRPGSPGLRAAAPLIQVAMPQVLPPTRPKEVGSLSVLSSTLYRKLKVKPRISLTPPYLRGILQMDS